MPLLSRFRRPYWNIGIVDAPVHRFLDSAFAPAIRWLEPPSGEQFVADPFGVLADNRAYVFCELFDYTKSKGVIAYFEIDSSLNRGPIIPIIELDCHASYPFVFEYCGKYYCIPETFQAREISVYAAERFPDAWQRVGPLIDGFAGNDSTLAQVGDLWWLFTTDYDRGFDSALCIWHAPTPFGPWQPHPENPVKNDKRSACSAGPLFTHNGNLYRPAQDCSVRYGGRMVLQQIEILTTTSFKEKSSKVLTPPAGPYDEGFHTLSPLGDMTLVDGATYRFEFAAVLDVTRNNVSKAARRAGIPQNVLSAAGRWLTRLR